MGSLRVLESAVEALQWYETVTLEEHYSQLFAKPYTARVSILAQQIDRETLAFPKESSIGVP